VAPVSRKGYPSLSATIYPTLLLPEALGPSMAMVRGSLFFPLRAGVVWLWAVNPRRPASVTLIDYPKPPSEGEPPSAIVARQKGPLLRQ
jgi:hypothetical protein